MYQFLVATSVMPHQTRRKIQFTAEFNARSSPQRYSPKNVDVRITTSVVA